MFIFQTTKKLLLAALLLPIFSCQNERPPVNRLERLSTAYCECTANLVAKNQEIAALAADTSARQVLMQKFQELQAENQHVVECLAPVIAQFGKVKEAEFPTVESFLKTKCPAVAGHGELLREMLAE